MTYRSVLEIVFAISVGGSLAAQSPQAAPPASGAVATAAAPQVNAEAKKPVAYILGPQDAVLIKLLNADELGTLPYPIDLRGMINVPMAGRIHAAGLTVEQLEGALTERFKEYLQDPVVTVTVAEFHSQRISVLGQVTTPGVHQIQGEKTLFEVISRLVD
jgi:polysaccharide export outer membrane protein